MDKYDKLSREELIRLLSDRDGEDLGGIRLSYPGQRPPWQIVRQIKPRSQRIERKLCHGTEAEQCDNLIIEGENLQALVSLYKYRGQVDLIVTDPPYNTGQDFRYNDKWDENPNDPELGDLVPVDDGSRHSKWLRFMKPRVWMMKEMLRPNGVLAICIDHRELYRLGMLLDEIFGESNRLAIINWQKTYAPKNNVGKKTHVSTSTEYVLVYAKSIDNAKTRLLPRSEAMNARYGSEDGDPELWAPGDFTGRGADTHWGQVYAVQNPFTGEMMSPSEGRCWAIERSRLKGLLEQWGVTYVSKDMKDGRAPSLVLKEPLALAKAAAQKVMDAGRWPMGYWRDGGKGHFRSKVYLKHVRQGIVPMSYWSDEAIDEPEGLGSMSWDHEYSGHSQTGFNELNALVGKGHGFTTVKPLKLFRKIVQIWCPKNGIVLDPFAGSGTTGQAVLESNAEDDATRRFILVEQGRPDRGDPYARGLTVERMRRAITGERFSKDGKITKIAPALAGGFRFSKLNTEVDAAAVLAL